MTLLFVYGTLRRGGVNHHLLQEAHYCGSCRTPARYRMLHLGSYPGVVNGGHTAIEGEVYRVNARQWLPIERLEDYPHLYRRRLIPTPWGRAWIYLYQGPRQDRPQVASGCWTPDRARRGGFSLY